MPRNELAEDSRHNGHVSLLKWITLVLVLSNLGLGVLSFYVLRRIDRQYSDLIDHSVPVLGDLQELTVNAMRAMQATNPAINVNPSARAEAVAKDRNLRARVLAAIHPAVGDKTPQELRGAGDEFSRLAEEVIAQVIAGNEAKAGRDRDGALRTAFDRYIAAATKGADDLEGESIRASSKVSDSAGSMSSMVVGFGSWPVIILLAVLLLTAAFIFVLMVIFRGREISDTP